MSRAISFIFDDGYKTEYTQAFPLFKKYGLKACSAITSDFIGKTKAGTNEQYANASELLEMQNYGWEILSHGKTHKELAKTTIYEADLEIAQSKRDLIKLGFKVESFVYPCHSYTDNIKYLVSQHYRSARGKHGLNICADKFELSGIMIDDHTQLETYQDIISTNRGWVIFYCHLCTSKIIASTIEQRLNTTEILIEEALLNKSEIKTIKEVLNGYSSST